MRKAQQVTYLSALIIMVSGVIGVGIFFKNQEIFGIAQGNVKLSLIAWGIAIFGVIMLGLAVAEMCLISSGGKGILEWTKSLLPPFLNHTSRNYIQLLFAPITIFALSLYEVQTLKNAGLPISNAWILWAIALAIFVWSALINVFSLRLSEGVQWLTLIIKFVPIFVFPIIGFIHQQGEVWNKVTDVHSDFRNGLNGLGDGYMVLIAGIAPIMFAFDGFYSVTVLKPQLKQPKKLGSILALGLSIISVIYIFITLGFVYGTKTGSFTEFRIDTALSKTLILLLSVGLLGVINGYTMFAIRTYSALHNDGNSWYTRWYEKMHKKIFKKSKISLNLISFLSFFFLTLVYYVIFGVFGIYVWRLSGTDQFTNLIGLADAITNYKAIILFTIISMCLIYALPEIRKNTKERWKRVRTTIVLSFAVGIVLIATSYVFINAIVDMTGFNEQNIVLGVAKFAYLMFIVLVCVIPAHIERRKEKKEFEKNYEEAEWANL